MKASYLTERHQRSTRHAPPPVTRSHKIIAFGAGAMSAGAMVWGAANSSSGDHSGVGGMAAVGGVYLTLALTVVIALGGGVMTGFPRTAAAGRLLVWLGIGGAVAVFAFLTLEG